MYLGDLVEEAPVRELFADPRHPYTRRLMACVPHLGGDKYTTSFLPIPGQPPGLARRPPGCPFAPRCPGFQAGRCDHPIPEESRLAACIACVACAGPRSSSFADAARPPSRRAARGSRRCSSGRTSVEHLRHRRRRLRASRRARKARRQRGPELRGHQGRDPRHRGRIRLRQVDLRARACRACSPSTAGKLALQRRRHRPRGAATQRTPQRTRRDPDGVPEPGRARSTRRTAPNSR